MTKDSLYQDLLRSGLKRNDNVLLHTSMKKIGPIDANLVLDVLIDYFEPGLLLFPTHTWGYIKFDGDIFNVRTSLPNVGILPTLFLERPGVIRSLHPTHSMAGIGKQAKEYLKGEELLHTPCDPRGVYGRLYDLDAKILLIGVNHVKNTYIHSVEESFEIGNRISSTATSLKVIDYDGKEIQVDMHRHFCSLHPHVSECYEKLDPIFLELGAEYKTKFGSASVTVVSVRKAFHVLEKIFSHEKQILVEQEIIPSSYYK